MSNRQCNAALHRALLSLATVVAAPEAAFGDPISVVNHSFEMPVLADGVFDTSEAPPGWDGYGTLDYGFRTIGALNPNGTELYLDPVPDGANVGVAFLGPEYTDMPAGLEQTLAATLETMTRYTLTVEVGNLGSDMTPPHDAFDFDGFPGYRIELLAGGEVIGSDDDTLAPDDARFATSSFQVDIGASHAQEDQPLGIRLINLDAAEGIEVNFDDVRLEAEPIECPLAVPDDCKAAVVGKGSLSMSRRSEQPAKSSASWSWIGEETMLPELGTPQSTSDYRVCVYDGEDELLVELLAAAGAQCDGEPCWKETTAGVKYRDRDGASGGLTSLLVKSGGDGKASIKLKAKGAGLDVPELPLDVDPEPVRVVLLNEETAVCWRADFSDPSTDPSETEKWKARND